MCGGVLWLSSSGLALLLRSENLALNIRKMVGLGLAPFIARFLLGVESCCRSLVSFSPVSMAAEPAVSSSRQSLA